MKYLILDVAFWVYLSKGHNRLTDKTYDQCHFKLLQSLSELQKTNQVSFLINESVLSDWTKNKLFYLSKIKSLKGRLERAEKTLKQVVKCTLKNKDQFKEKFQKRFTEEIALHETHIQHMDVFLNHQCILVEITDEQRDKVFDLMINRQAPFHHHQNNIYNITMLFSADNYLKDNVHQQESTAMFVSYNEIDFTNGIEKNAFHPDILARLSFASMLFQCGLPQLLNLTNDIRFGIDHYFKHYSRARSVPFSCKMSFCEGNENTQPWSFQEIPVRDLREEAGWINHNSLEPGSASPKNYPHVKLGDCMICETTHLECPCCQELMYIIEKVDPFPCQHCFVTLQLIFNQGLNQTIILIIGQAKKS